MISKASFTKATSAFEAEFIFSTETTLLTIEDTLVLSGIPLMKRHNINATDSAILALFLHYAQSSSEVCFLVAADERLVRAAKSEGMQTISPQEMSVEECSRLLAQESSP